MTLVNTMESWSTTVKVEHRNKKRFDLREKGERVITALLSEVSQADVNTVYPKVHIFTKSVKELETNFNWQLSNAQINHEKCIRYWDPWCIRMILVISNLVQLINVFIPQIPHLKLDTHLRHNGWLNEF